MLLNLIAVLAALAGLLAAAAHGGYPGAGSGVLGYQALQTTRTRYRSGG
jgi:hypothetical protein